MDTHLVSVDNKIANQFYHVLSSYQVVAKTIKGNIVLLWTRIYLDIKLQLKGLVYPDVIDNTPLFSLGQPPRYFKGIEFCLERFFRII